MVKVHGNTTDCAVAWRVRDALAAHPLLGGATAHIEIIGGYEGVVLEGWVVDEGVVQVAVRLACRAAGRRSIQSHLRTHPLRCAFVSERSAD